MSARRSSTSSRPTLIRTSAGDKPVLRRSASDRGDVDMSHGTFASDSTPPSDSASVKNLLAWMNVSAAKFVD